MRISIQLQEAATWDPFLKYVMLGDKIEDGVLAWYQLRLFARNYGCRVQLQGGRREARSRQIIQRFRDWIKSFQMSSRQRINQHKTREGARARGEQNKWHTKCPYPHQNQANNTNRAFVYRFFFANTTIVIFD
jgi:hypothetical protein